MKGLGISIIILFQMITITISKQNTYAQEISPKVKELYKAAVELTEIDSYGRSKERHELGIKKFREAIELAPDYYEAYIGLAKAYWDYGIVYIGSKIEDLNKRDEYLDKAREIIKVAIKLRPERYEAYLEYWNMLNPNSQEAKRIFKKLYELAPDDPEVMTWRGYDLIEEGRVKEGVDLVMKGMTGGPSEMLSKKQRLMEKLKEKGYEREAEEIIERMTKEEKAELGYWKIKGQEIEEGLKLLKESGRDYKEELPAAYLEEVAEYFKKKGMKKEAAEVYDRAAEEYEKVDPLRHKEKIREMKEKAKRERGNDRRKDE